MGAPRVIFAPVIRVLLTEKKGNTLAPVGRSDEAILAALAQRDLNALEELYDRYGKIAYSLAYRIVGDRGTAEDVLQEAFLSVWRRAGSYRTDKGSARNWLLSIVHHRSIDRLRHVAASGTLIPYEELPE